MDGGVVRRKELKDLYLVWGIGLIMTMNRAESKMWKRMGDWRYSPTHSYLGTKRRRTVSIEPNR